MPRRTASAKPCGPQNHTLAAGLVPASSAVAAKVKAAIRPLDAHRLARLHLQGQLPRVVAQRLDGKPQHAVALVSIEQGEGVRPFGTAKGDKRKLTGRMLPATGG